MSASSGSSPAATGDRATSDPRGARGTSARWPSTRGLAGEPGRRGVAGGARAFGYGHVYEQARCHWRLSQALVAAGDRDAARTHAREAAAAAERMGAVPLQHAVAATVSRDRLAAPRSAVDAVLTEREREVLALVAEGLTNREIGSRLFISAKTASVHLSNLMVKLNVSSRTEAVTSRPPARSPRRALTLGRSSGATHSHADVRSPTTSPGRSCADSLG